VLISNSSRPAGPRSRVTVRIYPGPSIPRLMEAAFSITESRVWTVSSPTGRACRATERDRPHMGKGTDWWTRACRRCAVGELRSAESSPSQSHRVEVARSCGCVIRTAHPTSRWLSRFLVSIQSRPKRPGRALLRARSGPAVVHCRPTMHLSMNCF
jgi:hypothetical protein